MPQLDLINWLSILVHLAFFVSIAVIVFLKYVFYSWSKLRLLKSIIKNPLTSIFQKGKVVALLAVQYLHLKGRQKHFSAVSFMLGKEISHPLAVLEGLLKKI